MRKLLALLFCFVAVSAMAQLPPILRLPWTTNSNGIVLNTNGSAYALTFEWRTNLTERRYNVKDFGAVGDGLIANGCFATNGSRVITCTNASFVAGDNHKVFSLYFGGTNGAQNWTSGISNIDSSTQLSLSNAVIFNVTNEPAVYGTDDGLAISNALFFAATNGLRLFFPKGIYVVNLPLGDVGDKNSHHNSQLWVPNMPHSLQRSKTFSLEGVDDTYGAHVDATPNGEHMMEVQGSVIWSTLPYGPDGTNYGSVLDVRDTSRATGVFDEGISANNITPVLENLHFRTAFNCNVKVVNLGGSYGAHLGNVVIDSGFTHAQLGVGKKSLPDLTGTNLTLLVMSQANNDNNLSIDNVDLEFGYTALEAGENTMARGLRIYGSKRAIWGNAGGGTMSMLNATTIQECGTALEAGPHNLRVLGQLAVYNYGLRYTPSIIINDPNGGMEGSSILVYQQGNSPHVQRGSKSFVIGTPNTIYGWLLNNIDSVAQPTVAIGNIFNIGNKFGFGADSTNATTLTSNAVKVAAFMMPRYSSDVADAAWGAVQAFNSSQTSLLLGRDASLTPASTYGCNDIQFFTSANTDGANGSLRWTIVNNGSLMPYPNSSGYDIGDRTVYGGVRTIHSTNYCYLGATNSIGTVVKGQLKITGADGSVYYIDLKQ